MKNIQLLGFEGEAPEESLVSRGTPLYFDGTDHFLGKAKLENEKYFLWLKEKNFFVFFRKMRNIFFGLKKKTFLFFSARQSVLKKFMKRLL